MKLPKILTIVAVLAAPLSAPVLAHHSYAMFDQSKLVSLEGSVVKFKWQNPHAWIEIDVPVEGKMERWAIEMTSPNNLIQQGFKRTSLKPGDKVTLQINPLRSGAKGGSFQGVRLANGTTLGSWDS